jgi:hypothetical protein
MTTQSGRDLGKAHSSPDQRQSPEANSGLAVYLGGEARTAYDKTFAREAAAPAV